MRDLSVSAACRLGSTATCAYVTTTPWNGRDSRACLLLYRGSSRMPAQCAASAHWVFRYSVGATTVIRSTTRGCSRSAARRSAKAISPAPGVVDTRKSRVSRSWYSASASSCHARSFATVPHAARSGKLGDRCPAADGARNAAPPSLTRCPRSPDGTIPATEEVRVNARRAA